jgi:NAD kinase
MRSRVVILTRQTQAETLVRRYGSEGQAKFMLAQAAGGTASFKRAKAYESAENAALRKLRAAIPDDVKTVEIDRGLVAQFLFEPHDLVVAVGQDGLVANVGKYLDGQPLAGVNPDPDNIDGALLPFDMPGFIAVLRDALNDRRPSRDATLAEAITSDKQTLYGLNEIFVGVPGHQSARYRLYFKGQEHEQSSSGLIVATGTGSSGWLKSLQGEKAAFDPADDRLRFAVREAWPGKGFSAKLTHGDITGAQPLTIESRMEAGIVFADGIEQDSLRFDAGITLTIRPARRKVHLIQ